MRTTLQATALVLAVTASALAGGSAGTVDVGFGTQGVLVLPAAGANSDSVVFDVQAQPDGRILAAGYAGSGVVIDGRETVEWRIQRLLADGQADATFGVNGVARFFGDPGNGGEGARALHVDGSGRIWVGGRATVATGTTGKGKKQQVSYAGGAVVLCLSGSGALDPSFGAQGEAQLFGDMHSVQHLVPLPGGDVLVLGRGPVATESSGGGKGKKGRSGGTTTSVGIVIARLDANGVLDPSYGTDGFARLDLDPAGDGDYPTLHGGALQSDGSLVVMTTVSDLLGTGPRVGLVRFDAGGARDTTFGDPRPGIYLRSFLVDGLDRIVTAGYFLGDVVIQRYDADGLALDGGFGSAGEVVLDTSVDAYQTEPLGGTALHLVGTRLLVACMEWIDENVVADGVHAFAVRLLDDGTLDAGFAAAPDGFSQRLQALAGFDSTLMPDGDLVIGGQSYASSSLGDWGLGRICGD